MSVRLRALEWAAALELGFRRRELALQVALEVGAWSIAGVLLVAPVLVAAAQRWSPVDPRDVLGVGSRVLLAALTGPVFGAWLGLVTVLRRPVSAYVKTR